MSDIITSIMEPDWISLRMDKEDKDYTIYFNDDSDPPNLAIYSDKLCESPDIAEYYAKAPLCGISNNRKLKLFTFEDVLGGEILDATIIFPRGPNNRHPLKNIILERPNKET